ncbi:MAG: hypothetical protein AB7O31_17930 [Burkholderiales bacterium]
MSPASRALLAAKAKAFGIHLSISAALFAAIIAACVVLWYPPPYFWIDGGFQVARIVALVDIVLGPLLTLVVFRPGKRTLRQDLAIIACVQLGFLAWGVSVLYRERPLLSAYIALPAERFFPIPQQYLADSKRPVDELLALSQERPALVIIRMPADPAAARELVRVQLQGLPSVFRQTGRYERLEGAHVAEMFKAARSKERIAMVWPGAEARAERFAAERGRTFDDYVFIPVHGRFQSALLAFERPHGSYAGAVYLPWD